MAVINPGPPPDGFYWYEPHLPTCPNFEPQTVVKITNGEVWVIGSDIELRWEDCYGLFVPIPAMEDCLGRKK